MCALFFQDDNVVVFWGKWIHLFKCSIFWYRFHEEWVALLTLFSMYIPYSNLPTTTTRGTNLDFPITFSPDILANPCSLFFCYYNSIFSDKRRVAVNMKQNHLWSQQVVAMIGDFVLCPAPRFICPKLLNHDIWYPSSDCLVEQRGLKTSFPQAPSLRQIYWKRVAQIAAE